MKYVFLYTELAEYTLVCLRALKAKEANNEILVIHFPVNPEAPFAFDFTGIGEFKEVSGFKNYESLFKCISDFAPDKIVCSGWINKFYVRICFEMRKKSICILTLDNHWNGSLKQLTMSIAARLLLPRIYQYVWVPGNPQARFAKKLGFSNQKIKQGFYCCDVPKFESIGKSLTTHRASAFPKRLLCVARYVPSKNYITLWEAFAEWQESHANDWELWCIGAGEGFKNRFLHPKIKHLGFLQAKDWAPILEETSVFILASSFEPWGVVVHEFSAAGFPMILSDRVGAATAFLEEGKNGWRINPYDKASFLHAFKKMENTSPSEMAEMGKASVRLAEQITPVKWATILHEL